MLCIFVSICTAIARKLTASKLELSKYALIIKYNLIINPAILIEIMAKVEIYTWSYCPYCMQAKQLLDRKNVKYSEYVIDDDESAREAMVQRGSAIR